MAVRARRGRPRGARRAMLAQRRQHRVARAADLDLDPGGGEHLLDQLRLRALGHDAPAVDDDHAVADHRDLGEDVRGEDHGVLAGERPDEGADLGDLLRVQPDGGLVEDQHLGIAQQRLGQAHALAVALGQLADEAARMSVMKHRSITSSTRACAARAGHALDLGHELEVCAHRQVGVERRVLGQVADAPPHLQGLTEHVEAGHPRAAARSGHEAREDLHGGGLAGPVGTEKAHDAAPCRR